MGQAWRIITVIHNRTFVFWTIGYIFRSKRCTRASARREANGGRDASWDIRRKQKQQKRLPASVTWQDRLGYELCRWWRCQRCSGVNTVSALQPSRWKCPRGDGRFTCRVSGFEVYSKVTRATPRRASTSPSWRLVDFRAFAFLDGTARMNSHTHMHTRSKQTRSADFQLSSIFLLPQIVNFFTFALMRTI